MALIDIDSFSGYLDADKLVMWTSVSTQAATVAIDATAGRRSAGSVKVTMTGASTLTYGAILKTYTTSGTGVVMGFAVKLGGAAPVPAAGIGLATVYDGATAQCSVVINSDFTISVKRGTNTGTNLQTSGATGITDGSTPHIQFSVTLGTGTNGSFDVRVNDVSIFSGGVSSVNTSGAGTTVWSVLALGSVAQVVVLGGVGATRIHTYSDYYLLDKSGSSHSAFLGDMRVDVRAITGAGTTTQFTPSTGANYQNVDDVTPNGDTDYNSSVTAGHIDTFVIQDAPVTGAGISAVKVSLYQKKGDAGTCTTAPVIRHSGTNYAGTAVAPSTSYSYGVPQLYPTNPGTSAAWVEADFNAAEIGYTKVS